MGRKHGEHPRNRRDGGRAKLRYDINTTFSIAIRLYRSGRLAEAEQACRDILTHDARHADSLHLLGVAASSKGRHADAIELIGRAIGLRDDVPFYYLNLGNALQEEKNFAAAVAQYQRAVALRPDFAEAHNNLGNAWRALNQPEDAVAQYRRALAIKPDYVEAHYNLGTALTEQGRFADAAAHLTQAAALRPDFADIHNNLGNALKGLGKTDAEIAHYQRAIALKPDMVAAHNNLGNALKRQGRLAEAVACFERALALMPDYAEAHNNLGNVLADQGKTAEAAAHFARALALKPDVAEFHNNIGNLLAGQERPDDAIAYYRHALRLKPDYAEVYNNLGSALADQGRFGEALAHYEKALGLKPDYAHAYNNLGNAYKDMGRLVEAERAYETAIAFAPNTAVYYRHLIETRQVNAGDKYYEMAERLAQDLATLPAKDQLELHFALGKASADLGQYASAFRHFVQGNALKRRGIDYDESAVLDAFERIKQVFSPAMLHSRKGLGDSSAAPVFIVGMPRSGTTLLEQILASHPNVFGAGERKEVERIATALRGPDPSMRFPEVVPTLSGDGLRQLGARYVAAVTGQAPAAMRIIDKMPGNFLYLGLIHLALPNARIIHVRRDPIDTCLSCFSLLFSASQPYSHDLGELARYYRAYDALMTHWRGVLPPDIMLDVQYEDIVSDMEQQARRVVAFCGLEWNGACLTFHRTQRTVRTASAIQVRRPIYGTSVGRWRHYREFLQPLIEELGTVAGSGGAMALPPGRQAV